MQKRSPRLWSFSEQARWLEGKSRHNCRHGTHPGIPPTSPRHVPNWPPHLVPRSRGACWPATASSNHPSCKVLEFCPITPAHRKPPWPGYKQGVRLFTKLLVAHPLVGVCLPPDTLPAESLKLAGYMVGSLFIRGHSAGSYAGMVWETILAEFPCIEGNTVLAAIALPPSLLTRSTLSYNRQVHLIHHADDRLCVWTPSHQDMKLLQQQRFIITHITGWRAYLGTAQHNYAHWTRVALPEGRHDLTNLERIPGVLPFEVYAHAPLRLISWCSFELNQVAKRLLRDLAVMCEEPTTTTKDLVDRIALRNTHVQDEQDAAISRHAGHSAHRIQSPNAHIHDNGPTLPRHPATAHGHLYVGLLPTNAQPQWRP